MSNLTLLCISLTPAFLKHAPQILNRCAHPSFTPLWLQYNQQYWDQQVSGAFYYNDTDATWTPRAWADPSTGVVHMYHSSRWGGWIFQLQARNDSDARLTFACRLLKPVRALSSHAPGCGPCGFAGNGHPYMFALDV